MDNKARINPVEAGNQQKNEHYQFYEHINVLIKPTDGCNLRCKYCFHQDIGYSPKIMEESTLLRFCEIAFPHYKSMTIVWHGGEPTFIGAKRFEEFLLIVEEQAKKHDINISQIMQTNGTLITQEFIDVIKKHNVGIGISYDGPVNNYTRGSTERFLEVNELLKKNQISFGIIAVVSGANVNNLPELYDHMCRIGRSFQINHYVNTSENAPKELNMSTDEYIEAMKELFDIWVADDKASIKVDPFGRLIGDIYHGRSCLCARSSCMRNWFCMESTGELTPCDRDFPSEYHYSSIFEYEDIRQIYESAGYMNLMSKSIERRKKCKETCPVYGLCEGGCNNNALFESGLENNGGFTCIITQHLIQFVKKRLEELCAFEDTTTIRNPVLLDMIKKLKAEKN